MTFNAATFNLITDFHHKTRKYQCTCQTIQSVTAFKILLTATVSFGSLENSSHEKV